jgi:hypothetical protein
MKYWTPSAHKSKTCWASVLLQVLLPYHGSHKTIIQRNRTLQERKSTPDLEETPNLEEIKWVLTILIAGSHDLTQIIFSGPGQGRNYKKKCVFQVKSSDLILVKVRCFETLHPIDAEQLVDRIGIAIFLKNNSLEDQLLFWGKTADCGIENKTPNPNKDEPLPKKNSRFSLYYTYYISKAGYCPNKI